MAPKMAAMDTWWPQATVRIGLAVPGRPIGPWPRRTGAPEASATRRDWRPARAGGLQGEPMPVSDHQLAQAVARIAHDLAATLD